ncbi:Ca2+/Na+ antiporter [Anoxybacillus eryuanensis]
MNLKYVIGLFICLIPILPIIKFALKRVETSNINSKQIDAILYINLPIFLYFYLFYIFHTNELSFIFLVLIFLYSLFFVTLFFASAIKEGIARKIINIWKDLW